MVITSSVSLPSPLSIPWLRRANKKQQPENGFSLLVSYHAWQGSSTLAFTCRASALQRVGAHDPIAGSAGCVDTHAYLACVCGGVGSLGTGGYPPSLSPPLHVFHWFHAFVCFCGDIPPTALFRPFQRLMDHPMKWARKVLVAILVVDERLRIDGNALQPRITRQAPEKLVILSGC